MNEKFRICGNCENLIKGEITGVKYLYCGGFVDYPEKCILNRNKKIEDMNYDDFTKFDC